MKRNDVENSINRSWTFLEKLDLAESFSNPSILQVNEEFRDLALNLETSYTKLYMNGLQNSHYNILLTDHSYFQFSWSEGNNVRYAFYANPFVAPGKGPAEFRKIRELYTADMINLEQYHALLNDAQPENRIPLIRYENAPTQYRRLKHPCSHFHIGHHSENRWAVKRILTPSAFTTLVAKQYYNEEWEAHDLSFGDDFDKTLDSILIAEREDCRIIGDDYFDDTEARSFHFG